MQKILLVLFITVLQALSLSAQKQKVIFDCDLGDDIDDAFALGMLLANQDKFDILGITTCYGRTDDRATLALKFLYNTNQEKVPVYIGKNTSGIDERANWYADQFYYSKDFIKCKAQTKPAADFILESINTYGSELIIFTVGPVTNMADVLSKDPNSLKKVKAIYSMFGSFYVGYDGTPTIIPEWNVKCDIRAAKKFVSSGANIIYAGLDITAMIKMDKAKRDKVFARHSPMTDMLEGLYVLWGHETPTLFDPVAIGMVLYPDLFKTKKANVSVDDKGNTIIDPNKPSNAEVGVYVNTNEFLNRLMKTYMQQNMER